MNRDRSCWRRSGKASRTCRGATVGYGLLTWNGPEKLRHSVRDSPPREVQGALLSGYGELATDVEAASVEDKRPDSPMHATAEPLPPAAIPAGKVVRIRSTCHPKVATDEEVAVHCNSKRMHV